MGVVDLDGIISQWARSMTNGVNSNTTRLDIDWSKVRFQTNQTSFPQRGTQYFGFLVHQDAPDTGNRGHIVFTSNYTNNTREVQQHTFKMERTTEATVKTSVSKGFSRNGAVGITIDVPQDVSNMTSDFGSDIAIDSQDTNTVKHTVKWGIDTTVRALPGKTVAELKINEKEHECDFEAEVIIRGRVLVKVIDNATGTVRQVVENPIATILEYMEEARSFNPGDMVTINGKKVIWKVSGKLKFQFGISQDVKVRHVST